MKNGLSYGKCFITDRNSHPSKFYIFFIQTADNAHRKNSIINWFYSVVSKTEFISRNQLTNLMHAQKSPAGECIHEVTDYHTRYITRTFRSLLLYCLDSNTLNTVQCDIIYSIQDHNIQWNCS